MRYLENAIKFTFNNFIIALPLLIATAIPAIIMGIGSVGIMSNIQEYMEILRDAMNGIQPSVERYSFLYQPRMVISIVAAGVVSIILSIIVYPATYGLINKKYETNTATLSDISTCISKYIGRFILFSLLSFAIMFAVLLVYVLLIVIGTVIASNVSTPIGILLIIIFSLAFIVGLVALNTYMMLWFPAVCVEDSGITEGLKNSFRHVAGSFWPILGISLLVNLCGSIAGSILGTILGWIPVMGSVVSPVIGAIASFIIIVFCFEVYRDKTGRYVIPGEFQRIDGSNL